MSEPIYPPKTYESKPCKTCSSTTRYMNRCCVVCQKIRSKVYAKTETGKNVARKYWNSEKGKTVIESPERKEYMKIYRRQYDKTERSKKYIKSAKKKNSRSNSTNKKKN